MCCAAANAAHADHAAAAAAAVFACFSFISGETIIIVIRHRLSMQNARAASSNPDQTRALQLARDEINTADRARGEAEARWRAAEAKVRGNGTSISCGGTG